MEQSKRENKRTPIHGRRNKLTVKGQDPAYQYRVVNATDEKGNDTGRVQDFQDAGYEVVTDDVKIGDKRVATAKQVGSPVEISVGQGVKAVLMRIKKEWYDEDQAAKAASIAETEQSMNKAGDYGKVEIVRK